MIISAHNGPQLSTFIVSFSINKYLLTSIRGSNGLSYLHLLMCDDEMFGGYSCHSSTDNNFLSKTLIQKTGRPRS